MQPTSLFSLATATRGEIVGTVDQSLMLSRVEIDSRRVQPGDLFWALRGERHDAHDFLFDVFHRGASAAVIRHDRLEPFRAAWLAEFQDRPLPALVAVLDTLAALADFARWYRSRQEALVIGVTGSFGKTTTREMIHAVLSAGHAGIRSLKNFNNHFGLPLSLLELDSRHEFAVLEMGASAVGEIAALCDIARPEVGVITGIGLAHVEGFGSPERIVLGKGELLEALPRTGFAVLPGDDPITRGMAHRTHCPAIFVGEAEDNHVRATQVHVTNQRLTFNVGQTRYAVPVSGRHFLTAALSAIAIAREVGLTPEQIATGLENFHAVAGRCQILTIGPWTVIDDSYNANPTSMRAACEMLRDWQGANKRLLIVGDMLELGEHSEQAHAEIGRVAASANIDGLLAFGPRAAQVVTAALAAGLRPQRVAQCETFDILLTVLDCVLEPGDVLLIKGSRGMRMERVIDWLRNTGLVTRGWGLETKPTTSQAIVSQVLPISEASLPHHAIHQPLTPNP
jgi:UDP-N-acetylmuramoyl-tripeptide--D-alanyl-D-alanine ligase